MQSKGPGGGPGRRKLTAESFEPAILPMDTLADPRSEVIQSLRRRIGSWLLRRSELGGRNSRGEDLYAACTGVSTRECFG